MSPIYLPALHNVRTGGPEAVHQLSDALLAQGFDCRLVYYTFDEIAALEHCKPDIEYIFPKRENTILEYAGYQTEPAQLIPNVPGTIVVLTESIAHLAPLFDKCTILIWWLSVDNGLAALSKVNLNHLRQPNVYHAAQSLYAMAFITVLQFQGLGLLSDYTTDLSVLAKPLPMAERPKLVVLNANPLKVTADLNIIIAGLSWEFECVKVNGLSRQELAELFARARAYVDLGSFPGKDRMPREAMRMGCHVIVSPHGAGSETRANLISTDLLYIKERLRYLGRNNETPLAPLGDEREAFFNEAKSIFKELIERLTDAA